MAIEWDEYGNDGGAEIYLASLGFFYAHIYRPADGDYRLVVRSRDGGGEGKVFPTLQEAQDAAVPMALAMVDGWRAELLELAGYKDLVARVEIQCEHVHESLGRCVREWGHTEGEHRYGAK